MPNAAGRAGTPAGVFGAELRYYRARAGLSQKDLAASVNVSRDVISKIETGERPPAEDFPERLDALPELDTREARTRPWGHLKKSLKQPGVRLVRTMGRHRSAGVNSAHLRAADRARAVADRGLRARAILSLRPGDTGHDLDTQVVARMARQPVLDRAQLWSLGSVLWRGAKWRAGPHRP